MTLNIHLTVIDPQIDFMDLDGSALPVPGANEDMNRLARMVKRIGHKLSDIHVTLDSHRAIDIAHPGMWRDADGNSPDPFTIITASDIEAGIWRPRAENIKPALLEGKTLGQYALWYARELESGGKYPLMIWPEHCLIGTPGYAVHPKLMDALLDWERKEFANVDFVTKGTNTFTEHYGALLAEVPMPSDPGTSLNSDFLDMMVEADMVVIAGEALSHCVKNTVDQIVDNIGQEHLKKFFILTDCSSPVPKNGDGPDFPAIADDWLKEMEAKGVNLTTSEEFLA